MPIFAPVERSDDESEVAEASTGELAVEKNPSEDTLFTVLVEVVEADLDAGAE